MRQDLVKEGNFWKDTKVSNEPRH